MPLSERMADIQRTFTNSGLKVLGAVWASRRAIDFALRDPTSENSVVRCTDSPLKTDFLALTTMLTEGDFDRAFLVHTGAETDLTSEIQTWPLSRIDELAALLAKESPP